MGVYSYVKYFSAVMASDPGPVMAIVTTLWAVHNINRMETVSKILT